MTPEEARADYYRLVLEYQAAESQVQEAVSNGNIPPDKEAW